MNNVKLRKTMLIVEGNLKVEVTETQRIYLDALAEIIGEDIIEAIQANVPEGCKKYFTCFRIGDYRVMGEQDHLNTWYIAPEEWVSCINDSNIYNWDKFTPEVEAIINRADALEDVFYFDPMFKYEHLLEGEDW